MEKSKINPEAQYGFKEGKDGLTQAKLLIYILEKVKRKNLEVHLLFIDISKAYDSIEFWAIEAAMKLFGFDDSEINVIKALFKNIESKIKTGVGVSNSFKQTRGVCQGDSISPTLFNLVISILIWKFEILKLELT